MENENKSSNTLIKSIIFAIIVGFTCLLFFGLGEETKTDLELVSFGFLLFAELVIYLSAILPGLIGLTTITDLDVLSAGCLYAIGSVFVNYFMNVDVMRTLIVYNVAAILIYLLIITCVVLMKKNNKK